MPKPRIELLVTDLDNTLWNWVKIWYEPFVAMLDSVVATSRVPRDVLVPEIRAVHQQHGTAEYAFVLEELPSLQRYAAGRDISVVFADAIETYRCKRDAVLVLYPGVESALARVRASGTRLVAFTESMSFYTRYRVRRLDVDLLLDVLYSPDDHALSGAYAKSVDNPFHREAVTLRKVEHRVTPVGCVKPAPDVLLSICAAEGVRPDRTVYVGDSLMKDVAMALDARVHAVHAAYGQEHDTEAYQMLRLVTHWTPEMVEKEREIVANRSVAAPYVLQAFEEIFAYFEFGERRSDDWD